MKKLFVNLLLCILAIFTFVTCNDPIFFDISVEVAPVPPLIGGSPSNIVNLGDNTLYVGRGSTLYWYNGTSWGWTGGFGRIYAVAATTSYLYMVTRASSDGMVLARRDISTGAVDYPFQATPVLYNKVRTIYAVGNDLFIGGETGSNGTYCIVHYNGSAFTKIADTGNELLLGAAKSGSDYYFCTKNQSAGSGSIYKGSTASVTAGSSGNFVGIITLFDNTTVVAIDRDGTLYNASDGSSLGIGLGRLSNGVLALWQDPDDSSKRLLLAGRQDEIQYTTSSGYTYGYLELELSASGGIVSGNTFEEPGNRALSTVKYGDNNLFKSTIGKYPVTSLVQYKGFLFASTVQNGAWSYRNRPRNGGWQWNAEAQFEDPIIP
jgi:hypothetical protein